MIQFKLKDTPPSKNKLRGSHWTTDRDVRGAWNNKTFVALTKMNLESKPSPPLLLKVMPCEPDNRKRDTLNYADEGIHGIQDGLVKARLIEDDSYRYIRDVIISYGRAKENAHTVVELFEIENLDSVEKLL